MENKSTTSNLQEIWLTERDVYLLHLMRYIDNKGGWDIRCGSVTIDFDKENKIGNVKIINNYKPGGEI